MLGANLLGLHQAWLVVEGILIIGFQRCRPIKNIIQQNKPI